jgi:[protein-PII] uridylyltransferase
VKICTWNRRGLFSRVAGAFAGAGMSILSAQVFSRVDGIIIDTFYVLDSKTGRMPKRENKDLFETLLRDSLVEEKDLAGEIQTEIRRKGASGDLAPWGEVSPKIQFNNRHSEEFTLIEVTTEDCVGLLHRVSAAMSKADLDIWIAKIWTEKGAGVDTFYVAKVGGGKIEKKEEQKEIEKKILKAIRYAQADAESARAA